MEWDPPKVCGRGHQLRYPNVRSGWSPCPCPKATGAPSGHQYVECLTCHWEWRTGDGCDLLRDGFPIDPPHRGTGQPGDPGYPVR